MKGEKKVSTGVNRPWKCSGHAVFNAYRWGVNFSHIALQFIA